MDTLDLAVAGGSEKISLMARKHYSDDFPRQAVDLYESTPAAALKGITPRWCSSCRCVLR